MRREKLKLNIYQPKQIDGLGKDGGYSAHLFFWDSYSRNRDTLLNLSTSLATASGAWTPKDLTPASGLWSAETTRKMMMKGKKEGGRHTTSMIFFMRSVLDSETKDIDNPYGYNIQEFSQMVPPKYVGFSWQQSQYVTIKKEMPDENYEKTIVIPVLYFRLRVFDEAHRRQHLGRIAIQLALWAYPGVTHLAHRTASPAAALSFKEAGVHKLGRRFPWDATYDTDSTAQQVMVEIHKREHIKGKKVNQVTGVSEGDYREVNKAYIPDLNHPKTMEIQRRMEEEFGMVFSRGDSLYCVYELK